MHQELKNQLKWYQKIIYHKNKKINTVKVIIIKKIIINQEIIKNKEILKIHKKIQIIQIII